MLESLEKDGLIEITDRRKASWQIGFLQCIAPTLRINMETCHLTYAFLQKMKTSSENWKKRKIQEIT